MNLKVITKSIEKKIFEEKYGEEP